MAKKKEKKAGKRMKKKELVKVLLEFFHTKQDEVLSLKYIFEQLHLTTSAEDAVHGHLVRTVDGRLHHRSGQAQIQAEQPRRGNDRNLPAQEQRQEFLYTGRWRRTDIRGRTQLGTRHEQ